MKTNQEQDSSAKDKPKWIPVLDNSFNPEEEAENAFQSWCEQYNDNCKFQEAWDKYADKYGQPQCEDSEVVNLVMAAIAFGAEAALLTVSNYQYDLERHGVED